MVTAQDLVSSGARSIGAVSPAAAATIVMRLFVRVGRPMSVRELDVPTMDRSARSTVTIPRSAGHPVHVAVYEWGAGDRTVVLAHGWQGRASQFAVLVRDLVAEGYRVVAFDAPAHGASDGRRPTLLDWIAVFRELQRRHGIFHATVGHSFGGLAALIAAVDGIRTERVVTVAAPSEAATLFTLFRDALGYDERVAAALRRRFVRRFFPGETDPFPRLSAVKRPLPSGVRLLVVYDEGDPQVPLDEAMRITSANTGAALLTTAGLRHNRILRSDAFLDAVLAELAAPIAPSVEAVREDVEHGASLSPVV